MTERAAFWVDFYALLNAFPCLSLCMDQSVRHNYQDERRKHDL